MAGPWVKIILSSVVFACVACEGPSHKIHEPKPVSDHVSTPANRVSIDVPVSALPVDWTPSDVVLKCAEKSCPPQVGVLLFAWGPVGGKIPVQRCTATLIAADQVISNGHCDGDASAQGYFVTQKINGQVYARKITKVIYKRFVAGPRDPKHPEKPPQTSGRPDVAIFELEKPITEIPPLALASGPQLAFDKLTAYVINGQESLESLVIQKVTCDRSRHEAFYPFNNDEPVDIIASWNCRMVQGNSGAPMFADGSPDIQSIHIGTQDPASYAVAVREELKREPKVYEKGWLEISTNVRCLDLPGRTPLACSQLTPETKSARFEAYQNGRFAEVRQRLLPDAEKFDFKFESFAYPLVSQGDERGYEVFYQPTCRMKNELKSVPFPLEHLELRFNEWAELVTHSVSVTVAEAPVKLQRNSYFELTISWPASPGALREPDKDIRKVFGPSFSFDLPECPR